MLIRLNHIRRVAVLALAVTAVHLGIGATLSVAQDKGNKPPSLGSGIEKQHFSKTIKPGQDFYRHVNDTWLENTQIPADQSNYVPSRPWISKRNKRFVKSSRPPESPRAPLHRHSSGEPVSFLHRHRPTQSSWPQAYRTGPGSNSCREIQVGVDPAGR